MHLLSPVKSEELTCLTQLSITDFCRNPRFAKPPRDSGEANSLRSIDAATAVGDADEFLDLPYRSFK